MNSLQSLSRNFRTQILQKYGIRGLSSITKQCITVDVNDKTGIATLNMNSPPVNTLNLQMLQTFCASIRNVEENKCRGLILKSKNDGVFTAGLDINEMYKPDKERLIEFYSAFQDSWLTLYSCSVPTAALINGHSPAGGCVYSTCCEYRVMLPNFTIGLNETKLGLVAPNFVMSSFCNVIPKRTAELALTQGRMFTSAEAFEIGLVDDMAPTTEDALKKCENFFALFTNTNFVARNLTKQQFRAVHIEEFRRERASDLNDFVSRISEPNFQLRLGLYFDSLKKKKM